MQPLSGEAIAAFHRSGFLAVDEPIVEAEEIERLRDIYDRMFAARAGRADGNQLDLAGSDEEDAPVKLSQILDPQRYYPELAGPALEAVRALSEQLLGPDVRTEISHAIMKPGGNGMETPWHQDEAYWDPSLQYLAISIWMPLQPVTIESGCMWFMTGSHEWDVLEHRSIGGDIRVHGLELVDSNVIVEPVACPLPAGGVTIHRNRTAHYTGPNLTVDPRRALIFGAMLPETQFKGTRRFAWNEIKRAARATRASDSSAGVAHALPM